MWGPVVMLVNTIIKVISPSIDHKKFVVVQNFKDNGQKDEGLLYECDTKKG